MTAPHYRIECAEALHFLRTLDTASIDAVITDPPYCSGGQTICVTRVTSSIHVAKAYDIFA